jgi:peptide/nickel transport system ATP-binding protein
VNALHHVSLEVNRGETLALVGESGSGKSITSLSILRLVPEPPAMYAGGSILFSLDGLSVQDLLTVDETAMRCIRGNRISMIFQEPMSSLNPVTTCGKQVSEAIRLHRKTGSSEARKEAIALFRKVELPEPEGVYDRYPHELSGGQKQRVMIAMAMSCSPDLLIADEPTTALDVTVQQTVIRLLRNLQRETGMSVIFITHDLGLVAEVADRVAVMYKGSIVETGPTRQVLGAPVHAYTKALLACRPILHTRGERLPVVSDFMVQEDRPNGSHQDDKGKPDTISLGDAKTPVVEVADLKVWFPGRQNLLGRPLTHHKAVDGVSMKVMPGETVGLVGESGCGKTTLGRAILGLVAATSGKILLGGRDSSGFDRKAWRSIRKDVQVVFQDPYSSLNPRLTIGEAIAEPMAVHGLHGDRRQRMEKVAELLGKVDLGTQHMNRYPHEFSGGQRQRIGIARALALEPRFIVFDESVSALDVSVQAQVLNLLNDLKREFGFTSLFISHDLGVVRYISDRILVMNRGIIEEEGPADEVYHHPRKEYTRRLIEAIPKATF